MCATHDEVYPDQTLIKQIFPFENLESYIVHCYLQDSDKCVFKLDFPENAQLATPRLAKSYVVRLEAYDATSAGQFRTVAAMQQIAAARLPDIVPDNIENGIATDQAGRSFCFSVMSHVEGTPLQDLWDDLGPLNRASIIAELVDAVRTLHSVRISDGIVRVIARHELDEADQQVLAKAAFGGPLMGFQEDGVALLTAVGKRYQLKKDLYQTTSHPKYLELRSEYEEIDAVIVQNHELEQWPSEAVLCHNDLTPRNIILRECKTPDGRQEYKLAGLIDWELAGFYPPSFELALQDTFLSGGNRHISYYLALKQSLKEIVPRSPSQLALVRAVNLIFMSRQMKLSRGRNIPGRIWRTFLDRFQLVQHGDIYVGWAPETPELSSSDAQKLEDDVIEEVFGKKST